MTRTKHPIAARSLERLCVVLAAAMAALAPADAANGIRDAEAVAQNHLQVVLAEPGLGVLAERDPASPRGKADTVVFPRPQGWLGSGERKTVGGVEWVALYPSAYKVTYWIPAAYAAPWQAPPETPDYPEAKERWCAADDNWAGKISPDALGSYGVYGVKRRGAETSWISMPRTGPATRIAANTWTLAATKADGAPVTWTLTLTNACVAEDGMSIHPWELDTGQHKACCDE